MSVPYKPYQSKRHSRNLSSTFTPPQSPPLVAIGSPSKSISPQPPNDPSKRLSIPQINFNHNDNSLVDISSSPPAPAPPVPAAPLMAPVISNDHEPEPVPAIVAPSPIPVAIVEVPPSPISEPATAPASPGIIEEQLGPKPADTEIKPESNGMSDVPPTAPAVPAKVDIAPAMPRPRPLSSSTFRHVPARASPLRPTASVLKYAMSTPSSPLGNTPGINRSSLALGAPSQSSPVASNSSLHLRPRNAGGSTPGGSRVRDFTSGQSPLPSPSTNGAQNPVSSSLSLPGMSRPTIPSPLSSSPSTGSFNPTKSPRGSPAELSIPVKSNSTPPSAASSSSRPSISPAPSPAPGTTAMASGSSTSTIQAPRSRVNSSNAAETSRSQSTVGTAPYRHGFQPKGVYGQRTDEFLEARRTKRDMSRVEDRRLERRLEKLIDLHFSSSSNSNSATSSIPGTPDASKPPSNRRQSSFFDFDLSDLKGKNASDLWRGVLDSAATSRLGGGSHPRGEIRLQEQAITPWQEDAAVLACPLCLVAFNTLTNRKHHCRLCGKVVCSLPVRPPQRTELCSFLFVVDASTGKIEELGGDVVDYGVKRKDLTPGGAGDLAKKLAEEQEKYLKGVRICRVCRPTLRRRQYSVEAKSVPPFARLYEVLLSLEKEIEEMLPVFQEVVIRLSQDEPTTLSPLATGSGSQNPVKQASSLRKQLLEAFSQYDAIAKRIKGLRTSGPGSSQEKVQVAIANRATLFLQRNMFPLQSLPKPRSKPTHSKNNSTNTLSLPSNLIDISDQDAALAHTLQPLLEQEALLESFVEEANAQRKFEDAKTLKMNLKEIRVEIERLLNGREGVAGMGPKTGNAKV